MAWTTRLPAALRSNRSVNESHGDKAPARQKQTSTNPVDCGALAQRLRGSALAKLCTWEAVRERKFLESCGPRLLCPQQVEETKATLYGQVVWSWVANGSLLTSSKLLTSPPPPKWKGSVLPSVLMAPRGPFLPGSLLLDQTILHFLPLLFAWRLPEADLLEHSGLTTKGGRAEQTP